MADVLIVDDEADVLAALARGFEAAGHVVVRASSGTEAVTAGLSQHLDAAVVDIRLHDINGLRVARELRLHHPDLVCVAITGHSILPDAILAIRTVLDDYLEKPVELSALVANVERRLADRSISRRVADSSGKPAVRPELWHGMVGASEVMQRVFRRTQRVAVTNESVVIVGETGTGKELVAQAIHALSPRRSASYVAVNCTSTPDTMFDDAFFGHARGAFTGAERRHVGFFEEAHGGTLFLDEIGDLPLGCQTKLLRAVEERTIRPLGGTPVRVDVRLVAATNAALPAQMRAGRFRADLYHRLNAFTIVLPPLRERREDIALLADHFLLDARSEGLSAATGISSAAKGWLCAYSWPGNVRELRATVRRAALQGAGHIIEVSDFRLDSEAQGVVADRGVERAADSLADVVRAAKAQIECDMVERALARHRTREAAAKALGIDRRTLLTLMTKHRIPWVPKRSRAR